MESWSAPEVPAARSEILVFRLGAGIGTGFELKSPLIHSHFLKELLENPLIEPVHVLFVCSMNKWRSPTAVELYKNKARIDARAVGTSSKARRKVALSDIMWADFVIVMEEKHKQRLIADHRQAMRYLDVHVLHIEDRFQFMAPELVEELKSAVDPILADYL